MVAAFSGSSDPGLASGVPRHLLLLPESLLSRVLSRPSSLCGGRARIAQVLWRNQIPFYSSESSPLLPLRGDRLLMLSLARCVQGLFLRRTIRDRRRHSGSACEREHADNLRALLPLAPSFSRREARLFFLRVVRRAAT